MNKLKRIAHLLNVKFLKLNHFYCITQSSFEHSIKLFYTIV